MDRRTVLELFAGVAVAGFPVSQAAPKRVVIAGAGMIGANIAYQLVKRGAEVTVVERNQPGRGATANSFAWINAKKRPRPYYDLSRLGIQAWRQMDREFSGAAGSRPDRHRRRRGARPPRRGASAPRAG